MPVFACVAIGTEFAWVVFLAWMVVGPAGWTRRVNPHESIHHRNSEIDTAEPVPKTIAPAARDPSRFAT